MFIFSEGGGCDSRRLLSKSLEKACRILHGAAVEQLGYEAPGEWGRLPGLDRIPEVRTLRATEGPAGVPDNTPRSPTERDAADMPGSAAAVVAS